MFLKFRFIGKNVLTTFMTVNAQIYSFGLGDTFIFDE